MLSPKSAQNLNGVHKDLARVVTLAAVRTKIPFAVTEGCRALAREQHLIETGFSSLKDPRRCRHVPTTDGVGHAVDLAPLDNNGVPTWSHIEAFTPIAQAMKSAAAELKIPLEWGGDWKTFKDYSHFQLPWKQYP